MVGWVACGMSSLRKEKTKKKDGRWFYLVGFIIIG